MKTAAVWRGANDQWYITISAANGKKIADGAEGYASRSNATRAMRKNFGDGYKFTWRRSGANCTHYNMERHNATGS